MVERVACCECPALPPGAMMRTQTKLLLKARSESVATQLQGMSLVRAAARDHVNAQGLCRTGLSLTNVALWRDGPTSH